MLKFSVDSMYNCFRYLKPWDGVSMNMTMTFKYIFPPFMGEFLKKSCLGCFVRRVFCLGFFCPWDVLSWGVLSVGCFVLGCFVLGAFVWCVLSWGDMSRGVLSGYRRWSGVIGPSLRSRHWKVMVT